MNQPARKANPEKGTARTDSALNPKKFEEAREIMAITNKDLAEAEQIYKDRRGSKIDELDLAEFLTYCSKVRYVKGDSEIIRAFERATYTPYHVPGFSINDRICKLAGLCRELQILKDQNPETRGKPFPLGTRLAGKLLDDISHTAAGHQLRSLELKGIIRRISNGCYRPGSAKNDSAEFIFLPVIEPTTRHSQLNEEKAQDEHQTSPRKAEEKEARQEGDEIPF